MFGHRHELPAHADAPRVVHLAKECQFLIALAGPNDPISAQVQFYDIAACWLLVTTLNHSKSICIKLYDITDLFKKHT